MAKLWHPPTTYPGLVLRAGLLAGALVVVLELTIGPLSIGSAVIAFGMSFLGWLLTLRRIPPRAADQAKSAAEADRRGMIELVAFSATGRALHADLAVRLFRHALAVVPSDDPARAQYRAHLADALATRFERTGDPDDLDASIEWDRLAIEAAPAGSVEQAMLLADVCGALANRYQHLGRVEDLAGAIEAGRRAVRQTPRDHPSMVTAALNLAGALIARHERDGDLSDVDEAIELLRHAAALCRTAGADGRPAAHPAWAYLQANLSVAYKDRFRRLGRPTDIDAAVDAARAGLAVVSDRHPNQLNTLHAAGTALAARFEVSGDRSDLTEAIDLFQQGARRCPPEHPKAVLIHSALCVTLRERHDLDQHGAASAVGDGPVSADIDAAVDASRAALRIASDGHPHRAGCLTNLALALLSRFEATAGQGSVALPGRPADLDEALATATEAVTSTPADDPDRAGYLSNLAGVLRVKARYADDPADLDRAIELVSEAVTATAAERPVRAAILDNLGMAVARRLERFGEDEDGRADERADGRADDGAAPVRRRTVVASHRAAARTRAAPTGVRVKAAWHWGTAAFEVGDPAEALAAFSTAVELLPQVAWHGLADDTRQRQLALWAGLASDAACAAVACGQPRRAVELLDQGRSLLWSQALRLRDDFDRLAAVDPGLRHELSRVRADLSRPLGSGVEPGRRPGSADDRSAGEPTAADRRRLATRWDALIAQVRALPGFEKLFAPVSYDELRRAADRGPVAVVNVSRFGCHALLVTAASEPLVVPLPALTFDGVLEQAELLLGAVARGSGDDRRPLPQREADRHAMLDVLQWLWERVTEPVLAALGHTGTVPVEELTARLWWCPTGPLALLPLHAAGRHSRTNARPTPAAELVAGRVVSSYTPTVAALLRAREQVPAARPSTWLLAVGLARTPGQADLPAVRAELADLARLLPPPASDRWTGDQVTRARLLPALARYPVVHLACHAVRDRTDPARSALRLWDGPLTVAELAGASSAVGGELAYLSACETATGDPLLADEALHLAGVLSLIGYRDVVATGWAVQDETAARVAGAFYSAWLGQLPVGVALHRAVEALRVTYPADPLRWAPYLHTGGS
ncbi:CHAT domain-containing protein [Solwaraspora sp. WMMD406]|uniref:CHAT domain-containing protein n=1 Tax=Solwaraspora sp. WMMD406 TaxID=3016095 RepID=UPI002417CEB2|nr:CHAT domain-containing protein [Solwaraspora sp. WMMD406]MDG4767425.1 CHAT domain-containing protein [Solwaraspora sp. WMMD406]